MPVFSSFTSYLTKLWSDNYGVQGNASSGSVSSHTLNTDEEHSVGD